MEQLENSWLKNTGTVWSEAQQLPGNAFPRKMELLLTQLEPFRLCGMKAFQIHWRDDMVQQIDKKANPIKNLIGCCPLGNCEGSGVLDLCAYLRPPIAEEHQK